MYKYIYIYNYIYIWIVKLIFIKIEKTQKFEHFSYRVESNNKYNLYKRCALVQGFDCVSAPDQGFDCGTPLWYGKAGRGWINTPKVFLKSLKTVICEYIT